VDVIVIAEQGGPVWRLTNLLGRSIGNIREDATDGFTIYPEGHALETMAGYHAGRVPLSTPLWLRSRRTRGAFVVALRAKSIPWADLQTRRVRR
jgi:hypothetical protein